MEKYRIIEDLTSDVMFEAYGKTLRELFVNAAEAMFYVICETGKVKPAKAVNVEISAGGTDELMVKWLQELIALVDIEEMFFSRFDVLDIGPKKLKARAYGDGVRPGTGKTVVKAVTYYKFKIGKEKGVWKARITLDI